MPVCEMPSPIPASKSVLHLRPSTRSRMQIGPISVMTISRGSQIKPFVRVSQPSCCVFRRTDGDRVGDNRSNVAVDVPIVGLGDPGRPRIHEAASGTYSSRTFTFHVRPHPTNRREKSRCISMPFVNLPAGLQAQAKQAGDAVFNSARESAAGDLALAEGPPSRHAFSVLQGHPILRSKGIRSHSPAIRDRGAADLQQRSALVFPSCTTDYCLAADLIVRLDDVDRS